MAVGWKVTSELATIHPRLSLDNDGKIYHVAISNQLRVIRLR